MSAFDLLFLALASAMLITLGRAALLALSRRPEQAFRLISRLTLAAIVYFAVVIAVSAVGPRKILNLGDTQCFDDWCIAATAFDSKAHSRLLSLRVSSRARRASQRERNLAIYLTDRQGRRYDPLRRLSDIPVDSLLQPGESIELTRLFDVPPAADDLTLVISHEGGFPIGWFIIGYDTWFRKPPLIRLN